MRSPVRESPVRLRGNLDAPTTIVLSRGPARFEGWALADTSPPTAVGVIVNGGDPVSADVGHERPDVRRNLGDPVAATSCGWSAVVDLSSEPAGDLRVQVVASDAEARTTVIADRVFILRRDGLRGAIDGPVDGTTIAGELLVLRGWATSADGIANIDVTVGETILGQARLGLPRPDISNHVGERAGLLGGFEFRGIVHHNDDGRERVLGVDVNDYQGHRSQLGTVRVTFTDPPLSTDERVAAARLQQNTVDALARPTAAGLPTHRELLVFTHSLALGGGQLYLQDLLRGLVPKLQRCSVVARDGGILTTELESLGVDVVISSRGRPTDIASYEGAVRQLALFIRASGCSCVLLNTIGEWIAGDAAQRAGVPTIWAIHESFDPADWLDLNHGGRHVHSYVRQRLDMTLKHASRVVFESDATREAYMRIGVPPSSALKVSYGIDIDAIDKYADGFDRDAARRHHGLSERATILLCLGVIEERKGQTWLADAFTQVASAHPDAVLVLVGDHPSSYSAGLHSVVAAAGLGDRIRIVPITSDIGQWYALADVLISASDVESLPRSMLEAMAFSCPVLAASVFGIPELITDGETGWLMRPRDTVALIAGMHRVLSLDHQARRSVAVAAREMVRASYRAAGYVASYLELIDALESATAP